MKSETYADYLKRGGKVTICPPANKKEKRGRKRVAGPDYDTRGQEAIAQEPIDLSLVPESLLISCGLKRK